MSIVANENSKSFKDGPYNSITKVLASKSH